MALDVLKGLTPTRKRGSGYNGAGGNHYPVANGYGTNLGEGDPVKLNGGVVELATNDDPVLGVFQSVSYIDANGLLQVKRNFVAGTSSQGNKEVYGGYQQPMALIIDDPNQTYILRTPDSVAVSAGQIGTTFTVSAIGSVVAGRSQAVLDATPATSVSAGNQMVTLLGLWTGRDSEFGTAPNAVEVKLSNPGIVGEL